MTGGNRHGGVSAAGAAVLVLSACASGAGSRAGSASASDTPPPVVVTDSRDAVVTSAAGTRVFNDDPTISDSLGAAPDQVYKALIVVFSDLGIPATSVNPSEGLVASTNRRVARQLRGTPMSRYVSCGQVMTGPRADHDAVDLSVISRAKPGQPSGTYVETIVVATAVDPSGIGNRHPCHTTGALEARVHRAVRAALGP
jgi:hypothetical protein